jgi:translation initiation factor IF-3
MAHPEIGRGLLDQLIELLRPHGSVEQAPKIEGRTMTMILAPLKQKLEKEGNSNRGEAKAENA